MKRVKEETLPGLPGVLDRERERRQKEERREEKETDGPTADERREGEKDVGTKVFPR